jgi:ribosome maturation factor RimP
MAQRARGAAAGARPAARTGARPSSDRDARRPDAPRGDARRGWDLAAIRTRLRAIIEPVVAEAGLDLDDLAVAPAGRRLVVRVTVDGDDGVSHDELTEVSREISARLDAAEETSGELTPDSYTLEVSSPGVDRPLTLPRHWRRNHGRLVKVKAAERMFTGRIAAVDDHGVTLEVAGRPVALGFGDLGPGRVQIEFTRLADLADEDFGEPADVQDDDELDDDEQDDAEQVFDDERVFDDAVDDLDGPQQKEDGA